MITRLLGIFLLFCLIAPITYTFMVIEYQKSQIRQEVKAQLKTGLDQEELVQFKFTEEEKQLRLNWKDSKEFELNGEMYDVVETSIKGDTTYITCWHDKKETKLNKQSDQLISFVMGNTQEEEDQDKTEKRLHHFFKSLYFSETATRVTAIYPEINKAYFQHQSFCKPFIGSPPAPPPKVV